MATRLFALLTFFAIAGFAMADHALLSDGKILYNVIVPDGATTGGNLLRMRTSPASFGFDPRTDTIYSLPNHSVTDRVQDVMTTSAQVGRERAKEIFFQRQWNEFRPPPARPRLVMPSPAPKATPIPVAAASASPTPVPPDVVPPGIPLQERLDRQLQIFMKEQTQLSQDAATSVVQGLVTPDQATAHKVGLLQRQQQVLQRYYPVHEDTVRLAVDYWTEQIERARQTGRFDLENL